MQAALWRFFGLIALMVSGFLGGCGGSCLGCGGDGNPPAEPPAAAPPPPAPVVMQSFAYVASSAEEAIRIYRIEDNGALASGELVEAGEGVRFVAIHPSNRFVYAVNSGEPTISTYRLDPGTGRITDRVDVAAGPRPRQLRIHPSGAFAYVTNFDDGTVSIYNIDAGSGALTANATGPLAVGAGPSGIMIDPTGSFLFLESADGVRSYSIAGSGALNPISTVPMAADLDDIALAPSGGFLYVAAADGTVSRHSISATGQVGAGTTLTVGSAGEQSIYIEPRGRFAYVTNSNDNTVTAFGLHPQTGELVPAGPVSSVTDPSAMAMGPTGEYLYVASQLDATISMYSVNQTTGALVAVGSPMQTDGLPTAITIVSFPR